MECKSNYKKDNKNKDIMQKKARSGHPFIFLIDKRKLLLTRSLMNRLIYCKMSRSSKNEIRQRTREEFMEKRTSP